MEEKHMTSILPSWMIRSSFSTTPAMAASSQRLLTEYSRQKQKNWWTCAIFVITFLIFPGTTSVCSRDSWSAMKLREPGRWTALMSIPLFSPHWIIFRANLLKSYDFDPSLLCTLPLLCCPAALIHSHPMRDLRMLGDKGMLLVFLTHWWVLDDPFLAMGPFLLPHCSNLPILRDRRLSIW